MGAGPAPATSLGDTASGPGTPVGSPASPGTPAGSPAGDDASVHDPWPEVPPLTDADVPGPDDGYADPAPEPDDDDRLRYGEDPLDLADTGPLPAWPSLPGTTGTRPLTTDGVGGKDSAGRTGGAGRASAAGDGTAASTVSTGRPQAGMLDLTLSWATFAEHASAPGILGRIGPVTAAQARALAAAAANAPGTRWRVVLTDPRGHAIKTGTVTRRLTPPAQAPAGSRRAGGPMLSLAGPHASITGRVSVTIPVTALDQISAAELAGTSIRAAILRAAARAAARTRRQAAADQDADSGCAHTTASAAYRPPPTIRDFIEARDQTCRFPGCRQPAWRGDLDHTTPFHCGGLTCPCNLGPLCRRHHRLKQQQHWALTQITPGTFRWQTSAGRSYATTAHRHAP